MRKIRVNFLFNYSSMKTKTQCYHYRCFPIELKKGRKYIQCDATPNFSLFHNNKWNNEFGMIILVCTYKPLVIAKGNYFQNNLSTHNNSASNEYQFIDENSISRWKFDIILIRPFKIKRIFNFCSKHANRTGHPMTDNWMGREKIKYRFYWIDYSTDQNLAATGILNQNSQWTHKEVSDWLGQYSSLNWKEYLMLFFWV